MDKNDKFWFFVKKLCLYVEDYSGEDYLVNIKNRKGAEEGGAYKLHMAERNQRRGSLFSHLKLQFIKKIDTESSARNRRRQVLLPRADKNCKFWFFVTQMRTLCLDGKDGGCRRQILI